MARGIRFTKAEREKIKTAIEDRPGYDASNAVNRSILSKLESAELPVKKHGLSLQAALEAFRAVLGRRLIAPPAGAGGVFAQMARRVAALGLTLGDCTTVAKVAAVEWQGPVRAESLVRQADKLLAMSQQEFDYAERGDALNYGPPSLGDEEL